MSRIPLRQTLPALALAGLMLLSGCAGGTPNQDKLAAQLSEKYGTPFQPDGEPTESGRHTEYRFTATEYGDETVTAWYIPEREVVYDSFLGTKLAEEIPEEFAALVRPILGENTRVFYRPSGLPDCFETTAGFTAADYLKSPGCYASIVLYTDAPAAEHPTHKAALLQALMDSGYSCSLLVEYYPSVEAYGYESDGYIGSISIDADGGEILFTQDNFPEEEPPADTQ